MKMLPTLLSFLPVVTLLLSAQTMNAPSAGEAPPPVRRTTEAAVDQQVTAKDLIGRDVYDRQNNHLGEVVDVALGGYVPEELKLALSASDRDSYAASGVAPAPGNDTGRQQEPDLAQASDRELDDRATIDRAQSSATSTVFISVGGVLGVGAELVRAPLSALSYDRRHDRIVLDLRADEVRSVIKTGARTVRPSRPAATVVYSAGN